MDARGRLRILGFVLALGVLAGWSAAPPGAVLAGWSAAPPGAALAEAVIPAWHGGIDLYRRGVFTTQRTWLWCTAADIQIARNIVFRRTDHATSSQRAYFAWMRTKNRYTLPLSAGVDAAGWTAGFRHFVDDRYRLVASRTFDDALRLAVTRLRQTNLPVGITVDHGNHAWLLTGFTATADPLVTSRFTITSVRVTGPLYGLQSRNGYDMPPDTKLTPAQLRRFFTPWRYVPVRMVWDGRYVSIQPVPVAAPAARPSPGPTASPSAGPAAAASPTATPTAIPLPSPTPPTGPTSIPSTASSPATTAADIAGGGPTGAPQALAFVLAGVLAAGSIVAIRARRGHGGE